MPPVPRRWLRPAKPPTDSNRRATRDGNQRVFVENILAAFRRLEILFQPLEHREIWRDDDEMFCHRRTAFSQRVEITPHHRQTHHFGFARTRRHLESIAAPHIFVLRDAQRRDFRICPGELRDDLRQSFQPPDFVQINKCLNRLALAEVITEIESGPPESRRSCARPNQ